MEEVVDKAAMEEVDDQLQWKMKFSWPAAMEGVVMEEVVVLMIWANPAAMEVTCRKK